MTFALTLMALCITIGFVLYFEQNKRHKEKNIALIILIYLFGVISGEIIQTYLW